MKLACRGAIHGLPEIIGHRILLPDGSDTAPSISFSSDTDLGLVRATTNTLRTLATTFQIVPCSANTQILNFKIATTLLTIAAATVTSTWSGGIPANSIVIGISSRVTVVVPTATVYDVGIGGATTRYTTDASTAATTTSPGTDDGLRAYTAATDVVVTTDVNPAANTGRIRLTVHYIDITPPTS